MDRNDQRIDGICKFVELRYFFSRNFHLDFLQRADLAVTDFTITSERESGVDFTMPFMNLGKDISKSSF